jgi:Zn-dependent protease
MSPEEVLQPAPMTGVARLEPHGGDGFHVEKSDYGAFRAVEPGTHDLVLLRPDRRGLTIERPVGREHVGWDAVSGLELAQVAAGNARVAAARIRLREGPSLDLADALAPGADHLPFSIEAGGGLLLPVERFRLLAASVVASAGLAPVEPGRFERIERTVPAPEVTPRPSALPPWGPPTLLVLSVLVLVAVFDLSVTAAVVLTAVILIHELGHATAMRWTGMQVRGVLFLPFLGAATLPEHTFRSRWDEVRVTLAGPLTGVPVALAGWAILALELPWTGVGTALITFGLFLNLLNLIPLLPLDGGRILICLVAGLPRRTRAFASFLPPAVVFVALVYVGPDAFAFVVAVLLAFSFVMTRLGLRRQLFHQWMLDAGLPLLGMREALRDITHALTGVASEDADGGVAIRPLSVSESSLSLALYMASVLLLCAAALAAQFFVPGLAASVSGS